MKFGGIVLTAASAGVVLAQPHLHNHHHLHQHKRDVTVTSWAPAATDYVYVLNGQKISAAEACEGILDKELKFVDGIDPGVCSSSSSHSDSASTTTTTSSSSATTNPAEFYESPHTSDWSNPSGSSSEAPPTTSESWSGGGGGGVSGGATGLTAPFPDGELSCDSFPSAYGALSLDYLGMGGWSGLQAVTIAGGFVNHIVTGIAGDNCREGMMCSYACPPGYQKSQWPSTQGATGQSVGGLSCSGGKLRLTNAGLSTSLCIPGVGGVQATNNANAVVAICRTDYPGTESEVIPVELQPGATGELTVPDAAAYYEWQGQSTSAQYYLNPIGVSAQLGCKWGDGSSPIGNWAPINFGVGAKDGKTWLSIFQNAPTTYAQYQGKVEIQGNLSGTCKYENGQYCGVTGCNAQGCTVAVISGTATYVITN